MALITLAGRPITYNTRKCGKSNRVDILCRGSPWFSSPLHYAVRGIFITLAGHTVGETGWKVAGRGRRYEASNAGDGFHSASNALSECIDESVGGGRPEARWQAGASGMPIAV